MLKSRTHLFLCLLLFCLVSVHLGFENTGLIRGVIRDGSNGETLPYVNVLVRGTGLGAVTGMNGYYVIHNVPDGTYRVVASIVGYKKAEGDITVKAGQTATFDASLELNVIEMEAVISSGERAKFETEVTVSNRSLSTRELRMMPSLAEADLFRSLQMLPGVMAQNDFFSQLYVRGSSPDQNLILLDGVTVYNPYHLGGIFSTFNVDAVKEAELLLGGFPAQYGGRLASVLNVINKDGNSQEMQGVAEVSLLSSKLSLEGPSPKGSWMLSGRRTYFDKIVPMFNREFPYYFYDFHGKINYALGPNNRLILSGLYGKDIFDYEEDDPDEEEQEDVYWAWGNKTVGLTWQSIIGTRVISNVLLSWTSFFTDVDADNDEHFVMRNRIQDATLQGDWTFLASDEHELRFGMLMRNYKFSYLVTVDLNVGLENATRPAEIDFYLQDKWALTPLLSIQPGIRLSRFNLGDFWRAAPRLGFRYRLSEDLALNGSWGIYYQYLKTFNDEDLYIPMEMWFADGEKKPGRAAHYILGLEQWVSPEVNLTLEGYFKEIKDILAVNREFINEDDFFYTGRGEAWGVEVLVKKTVGKLLGWVGYGYAQTKKEVNGVSYYTKYDRRHALNGVLTYPLNDKWGMNVRWTAGSGLPYSRIIGRYKHREYNFWDGSWEDYGVDDWKNMEGTKNGFRYPVYNRLDFSLARTFAFKNWDLQMYVQVINVINKKNVLWYYFDYDVSPPKRKEVTMFPLLPTLGFRATF